MPSTDPITWPPAGRAAEIRALYVASMDIDDLRTAADRGECSPAMLARALAIIDNTDSEYKERAEDAERDATHERARYYVMQSEAHDATAKLTKLRRAVDLAVVTLRDPDAMLTDSARIAAALAIIDPD